MRVRAFVARHILAKLPLTLAQRVRKMYYARLLRSYPESGVPAFRVIRELVQPGDKVVDVGANIGVFTKHLSLLVGDQGRVYSIEPIPTTFDILCSNIKRVGLHNVEPIQCAVSDVGGRVTMEVPIFGPAGENWYRARIVESGADRPLRQVTVEAGTLDFLLADWIDVVSFVKCDVEGHEFRVLQGAARVIEEARPAWFIEVSDDPDEPGSNARATVSLLAERGYAAYWFDGTVLFERRPGDRSTDYFFLTPDHVGALQQQGLLREASG